MEGTLKMQQQFLSVRQKNISLYCCSFISLNVYSVSGKQLSHDKADKYLHLFGKNLDEFEDHI
ncbi:MAG: hypothetical protein ACI9D5_001547 [Candidatus Endobugula sp.]|jgi:hypothetical protein